MSCPDGSCYEPQKRVRALIMLGLMMLIFIMLSAFSFLSSREQVTPDKVDFAGHNATDGKRVFQAFNCMGCHTIVGNGAYFGPDLTKEYRDSGPAWIAAFLGSAGTWPTEATVQLQLGNEKIAKEAEVANIEEYYTKYPGAKERTERRKGQTYMPSLLFSDEQIMQLLAFLKYTSAMNTEGWPPEVLVGDLDRRVALAKGGHRAPIFAFSSGAAQDAAPAAEGASNPVEHGKMMATNLGCVGCHLPTDAKLVGPGWGKLFGASVKLEDGSTVTADEAYLMESIFKPNDKVVEGYPPGVMLSYENICSEEDAKAIVEYIKTLK